MLFILTYHYVSADRFLSLSLKQALKSVVLYVILSPYDNEQSDLVHRISSDKKLEDIPKYKYVASIFFLIKNTFGMKYVEMLICRICSL